MPNVKLDVTGPRSLTLVITVRDHRALGLRDGWVRFLNVVGSGQSHAPWAIR